MFEVHLNLPANLIPSSLFLYCSNLALVLTPNLIRDPSGDPLKMLRNNNIEQAFIEILIEVQYAKLHGVKN